MFKQVVLVGMLFILTCGSRENKAIRYAETLVKNNLIAPSTVKWIEEYIVTDTLDNNKSWYMISLTYDSQNRFGAMLRQKTYVIFYMKGDSVLWNENFYMLSREALIKIFFFPEDRIRELSDSELETFILLVNGWPGFEEKQKEFIELWIDHQFEKIKREYNY